MNISGEVVRTSQLPKKTLGLNDSLVALMSSPLETVTVPVSDFVSFVATQLIIAGQDSLDSVTTVGNTTANTITIGGATSPYYQLNTLSPGTQAVGRFVWNDVDGTVDLRLKGNNVTLQLGQETVVRVVNKTGADLLESQYKVVRVRIASEGGAQGQRLAVVLAQGNNDPDSVTTLGIVTEDIGNNQEGFITVFGNVSGINTTGSLQGETWADGDVLFLSPTTPGSLTKVKPVAPNHTVIMGYVVYAHQNNGKIFVKVDNGYELEELHDVLPTPYVNNGVLYRDTTANLWRSATIPTLLGGTPLLTVPTLQQVTNAGNTTTNAITVGGLTVNTNLIYTDTVNSRVGIGTVTPDRPLHINSVGTTGLRIDVTGAGSNAIFLGAASSLIRWSNGSYFSNTGMYSGINDQQYMTFDGTNTQVRLQIKASNGNIGINTTTDAGYKLDVNGTARVTSNVIIDGSLGIGTTIPSSKLEISSGATQGILVTNQGGATTGMTLKANRTGWFQSINIFGGTSITNGSQFQFGQYDDGRVFIFNTGNSSIGFYTNSIERFKVLASGNVIIQNGGTFTDAGYRLDVNGTTRIQGTTTITPAADTSAIVSTGYSVTGSGTTPLIDLSGTWNTTGTPTLIKFNVTNTASNASSLLMDLQIGGISQFRISAGAAPGPIARNGYVFGGNGVSAISPVDPTTTFFSSTGTAIRISDANSSAGYSYYIYSAQYTNKVYSSGVGGFVSISRGFAPTSGNGVFNVLILENTINQTGGANGITRGLYIQPTLTAAADWRSIEWSNNTGWGLFGVGTAPNYLGGSLVLGTTTVNASALLQVESTTKGFLPPRMTTAQILLISSPAEGLQVYNTDLKTICFYNGTAWQKVTSTAM